jgi:hypothetical protein
VRSIAKLRQFCLVNIGVAGRLLDGQLRLVEMPAKPTLLCVSPVVAQSSLRQVQHATSKSGKFQHSATQTQLRPLFETTVPTGCPWQIFALSHPDGRNSSKSSMQLSTTLPQMTS